MKQKHLTNAGIVNCYLIMKKLLDFKEEIKAHNPCVSKYKEFLEAKDEKERAIVVVSNLGWCCQKGLLELIEATHSITDIREGIKAKDWYSVRWAAENGHIEVLKFFHSITDISEGIKSRDWYAVRWAAHNGHLKVLKYLNSIVEIPKNIFKF